MFKALSIMVILLTCAGIGLTLALNPLPVSADSKIVAVSNAEEVKQPSVITTTSTQHFRKTIELIGISDTVALNAKDKNSEQVLDLWQGFANLNALHEAVNWLEPVNLYAYYTDFNFAMRSGPH